MPTNQEINNALLNAKVNTFSMNHPKEKATALRDLTIDTGIPDLTAQEQADYNEKVKEWMLREMGASVQMAIRVSEDKPKLPHSKTKKKFIKKGENFEVEFRGQNFYFYDTKLVKGVDFVLDNQVNPTETLVQNENKSSVGEITISKEKLPWLIIGAVVLILVLKN